MLELIGWTAGIEQHFTGRSSTAMWRCVRPWEFPNGLNRANTLTSSHLPRAWFVHRCWWKLVREPLVLWVNMLVDSSLLRKRAETFHTECCLIADLGLCDKPRSSKFIN